MTLSRPFKANRPPLHFFLEARLLRQASLVRCPWPGFRRKCLKLLNISDLPGRSPFLVVLFCLLGYFPWLRQLRPGHRTVWRVCADGHPRGGDKRHSSGKQMRPEAGLLLNYYFCKCLLFTGSHTHTQKVQKNTIRTKTQSANFRGNPLYQATKRHLNNR